MKPKLKLKPDMWQVCYRTKRSVKQIAYITNAFNAFEVLTKHHSNPKYKDTKIMSITNLIDEDY